MSQGVHEFRVLKEDQEFFARELESFVPDRVFDAHCHLWPRDALTSQGTAIPGGYGYEEYRALIDGLHPGRWGGSLFLAWPCDRECLATENEWFAKEIADYPSCPGFFAVHPDDDPEWVRGEIKRYGLQGVKCYHLLSAARPTWEADIPQYLPEGIVKVCDEEGWGITLHMVKRRAVADPSNLHWIRHYCETYPNMKLILAHSGRGFQPAHSLEALPQLVGLDNLFFDSSANCEPMAHQAIIRILGHKKLMYGSDFPVGHRRGRSLGVADTFVWLYGESPVWQEKHTTIQPVMIGLEHLRSLKWACWSERLSDSAVEDIFWNNAAELFALE